MEHESPRGFEVLLAKNVPHILEKIFFSLDYESFKNCFEVSKGWKTILTFEQYLRMAKSVFPENIHDDERKLVCAAERGDAKEVRRLILTPLVDVNHLLISHNRGHFTP